MSPEIKKAIAETAERELPLFDLLDMKYINLSESFFTPKGEDWLRDGKVYFKFDKSKIPNNCLEIIYDEVSKNYLYFRKTPSDNDEICIMYDATDKLANGVEDESKGGITNFAIRRNDRIFIECDAIGSILMYMDSLRHPKLEEAKKNVSKFANECYDWIKEKIRNTLIENVKGNFCIDNLQSDTYYQRRTADSDRIYDYIIHDWCRRMCENKPITWVDLMGEDKVYVALD